MRPTVRLAQRACEAAKARQSVVVWFDEHGQFAIASYTGATMSVVSPRLATRLGGQLIPQSETIEGRDLDSMAAELQVRAPDCGRRRRTVVVDAVLAAKAGPRAEMILRNDYMQRTDAAVLLSDRKAREGVACRRVHKRRK